MPIALTDQGRRLGELIQARRLGALRALIDCLDKKDRKELDRLLDKLLTDISSSNVFPRRACRLCDVRMCEGCGCPYALAAPEAAE